MNQLANTRSELISRAEAKRILEPYFSTFRQTLRDAWEEWEHIPIEQRSKINARARANCLYDFIVHYARVHFANAPGVTLLERRGLFLLGFQGRITIRFKKLGPGKKTSNIQTQQQVDFNLQIKLPGILIADRLTVGYILDATQTSIKDVLVTLQTGRRLEWDIPIIETQPTVIEMPVAERQVERKARIRIKKPIEQINA